MQLFVGLTLRQIRAKILGNTLQIEISDNGKGIANIDLAREPLYTSKPKLERSGMGFTIMESFMDELKVESIPDVGTKVTMKKYIGKLNETEEEAKTV